MERKDSNTKGGGLMAFYRSDLPVRRMKQYECIENENIFLELKLKNRSWGISCIYRPQSLNDRVFDSDLFAYSDALKNSFFPRTIPLWNSLPSSVVSSKTIDEFKGLI